MKTYNNLYPRIYDLDNLKLAYRKAKKGALLTYPAFLLQKPISSIIDEYSIENVSEILRKAFLHGCSMGFADTERIEDIVDYLSKPDEILNR